MTVFLQLTPQQYLDLMDDLSIAYNLVRVIIAAESDAVLQAQMAQDNEDIQHLMQVFGEQALSQLPSDIQLTLNENVVRAPDALAKYINKKTGIVRDE